MPILTRKLRKKLYAVPSSQPIRLMDMLLAVRGSTIPAEKPTIRKGTPKPVGRMRGALRVLMGKAVAVRWDQ